jgi:hypothetical protein
MWLVATASLVVTVRAWHLDAHARRLACLGRCLKCQYDRTGLAPNAVCPDP